jgi:lysine 6-dehydrogenase
MGLAAGYDLAKFGEAEEVKFIDIDLETVQAAAKRVNELLGSQVAEGHEVDINNIEQLRSVLSGATSIISAVPYSHNLSLTDLALELGTNMVDLGGHTGIVKKQLEKNDKAKAKGITIIPDCGMGPGLNISLALYAMSLLDEPREVYIYDGGLPQKPVPPWNYVLTFNIGGLTNEYYGNAHFIRDGKVTEVPCFEGYEQLEFPIGKLEAFVTSGGLSTMPWTFEDKLERLENKTLRYSGHCAQFKAFSDAGLLELESVAVGGKDVIPRELFHAFIEPRLKGSDVHDVCIIRVKCMGVKDGKAAEAVVELVDTFDPSTGFTAMQRLTGWHASIVAILAAKGKLEHGAIPIELAVPGNVIVDEAKRRGLQIEAKG